jgi:hypothetical protein
MMSMRDINLFDSSFDDHATNLFELAAPLRELQKLYDMIKIMSQRF